MTGVMPHTPFLCCGATSLYLPIILSHSFELSFPACAATASLNNIASSLTSTTSILLRNSLPLHHTPHVSLPGARSRPSLAVGARGPACRLRLQARRPDPFPSLVHSSPSLLPSLPPSFLPPLSLPSPPPSSAGGDPAQDDEEERGEEGSQGRGAERWKSRKRQGSVPRGMGKASYKGLKARSDRHYPIRPTRTPTHRGPGSRGVERGRREGGKQGRRPGKEEEDPRPSNARHRNYVDVGVFLPLKRREEQAAFLICPLSSSSWAPGLVLPPFEIPRPQASGCSGLVPRPCLLFSPASF